MFDVTRYRIMALFGIILASFPCGATPPTVTSITSPENILFVGNSFTYYNNSLHNHVRNMMQEGGKEVGTIRSMTISGARLKQHEPAIRAQLDSTKWDVVILQGNSLEPVNPDEVEGFKDAVRRLAATIHDAGAQPVLFMTWARTHLPEQIRPLNANYTGVGDETNSFVVPVGLAFNASAELNNGIRLRTEDRRHPTMAGSYLAACVFYAAMFGESPVGHSYTAGLDDDVSSALQLIAWQTVQSYYDNRK